MFSCIIIDDERRARKRIADFVAQQADWQVVAQAGEYHEAYQMINHHQPDICFMDINIIGGNGIELVPELSKKVLCECAITCGDWC
jgi:two-component system LytT family response regulator